MLANPLVQGTFSANRQREQSFFASLMPYISKHCEAILDLGCGDGSSTYRLATTYPNTNIIGIDLAPSNIACAASTCRDATNVRLIATDYLQQRFEPCDTIIADTVLHLIHAPVLQLFHKLRAELRLGGRLCASLPFQCASNRLLAASRKGFRAVRTCGTDQLLLRVATAIHGRTHSVDFLRERLEYMYIVPKFFVGMSLLRRLEQECGLQLLAVLPYPHTSIGQMRHRTYVWERR